MSFYSLRKTVNPHLPGNKKKIVEDLLNDLNKDLIKLREPNREPNKTTQSSHVKFKYPVHSTEHMLLNYEKPMIY